MLREAKQVIPAPASAGSTLTGPLSRNEPTKQEPGCAGAGAIGLVYIVISLAVIYGIVRFVRWAWYQ
jgi:hypothetical protein